MSSSSSKSNSIDFEVCQQLLHPGENEKKQRWNVIIVSLLQSVLECFEFFEDLYIFVYIALSI